MLRKARIVTEGSFHAYLACYSGFLIYNSTVLFRTIFYALKMSLTNILLAFVLASIFLPGSLSSMPAVQTFAVYATLAVAFDFVFQTTAFLALLALDQKRYDVCYALPSTNLLITIIIIDRQTVWMSWFVLNWTQKNLKNLQ